MKFSTHTLLFLAAVLLWACDGNQQPVSTSTAVPSPQGDPHSLANAPQARATHLMLDLDVDFVAQVLGGTATWKIEPTSSRWIVFDTDGLQIDQVTVGDAQGEVSEVKFELGKPKEMLGRALRVPISEDSRLVTITYKTSPDASALLWMDSTQTETGKPFMFSQGQAILTRSWVPIQDSPGNRITYEAKLNVPKGLMALMSAENTTAVNPMGMYQFTMREPIPPYLMAIAVGDLAFEAIGEQTGVYASPTLVEFAAREFVEVDSMMAAAERLYGPYPWGRYDILVLPASFPFGGMENPKLTFATPTILVGDRSLTSLIAHELAHSWSGNLVTNATWDDFWLNEGITTYIERRIMEEVSGRDYAEMLLTLGRQDLEDDLADLPTEDTRLRLDLTGRNPDDGMTDIAYEKGSLLMQNLEEEVGRERFDAFLRKYFAEHQFQTITTNQFVDYAQLHLLEPARSDFDLDEWIDSPGIPASSVAAPKSKRFAEVDDLRAAFLAGETTIGEQVTSWSTNEWLYFIRGLSERATPEQLGQLDEHFDLKSSPNAEIAAVWYQTAIERGYGQAVLKPMEEFLVRVGRRKFLTPLYRALNENGFGEEARRIYARARPGYHAVTRGTMDAMLK